MSEHAEIAADEQVVTTQRQVSLLEILWVSTRLGLTSFGGPIAHLGYFHEEYVKRRKWVDEQSYADLVALCQSLPGPTSSMVGSAIGFTRAGLFGTGLGGAIQHKPNPKAHRQAKQWHKIVKGLRAQGGQFFKTHPSEDLETALKALEIAEGSLEEVAEHFE